MKTSQLLKPLLATVAVTTSLCWAADAQAFINIAGTYSSTTTEDFFGVGDQSNPFVTITELEPDRYSISDVSGAYYAAFGFNENQPVTVEVDDFGNITIVGNQGSQFNIVADTVLGTFDPDAGALGVLTLPWFDTLNSFGDTTIFTRTALPETEETIPVPEPTALLGLLAVGGLLKAKESMA